MKGEEQNKTLEAEWYTWRSEIYLSYTDSENLDHVHGGLERRASLRKRQLNNKKSIDLVQAAKVLCYNYRTLIYIWKAA